MTFNRGTAASLLAIGAVLAGGLCPISDAYAQTVSDRVLSDVSVQTTGACATVTIDFNVRVQFLSFFPQTSGRELHIRIKPLEGTSFNRESLRSPTDVPAMRSIEYEGDNAAGPILSIFFNRDVQFSASAGARPQSIIVQISDLGSAGCVAADDVPQIKLNIPSPEGPSPDQGSTPAPISSSVPAPPGLYVVNVLSQPSEIGDLSADRVRALSGTVVYETRFERDGQTWHQLRVGFFESRAEAEAARAKLTAAFADTWVVKVNAQERQQGASTRRVFSDTGAVATATAAVPAVPLNNVQQAQADKGIADAEAAIKSGENDRAVQLLTKVLTLPENDKTPRALELLGLTREKKGQEAQARAEYEEYLRRYPTGEASDRVRQRLAGLSLPPGAQGGGVLRAPTGRIVRVDESSKWRWGVRGSFSQFYFRDQSSNKFIDATRIDPTAEVDNQVNLNQLLTNADISATGGNGRNQMLLRAAGSFTKDFRSKGRNLKSLSALYLDFTDSTLGLQTRIGRQSRNNSGVLGRFDGGLVSWQVRPKLKFNLVGGFPVLSSRQTNILTDRFFYGLSADIGSRKDKWQTTLYWFDQKSQGFIDRRSVGVESRYFVNSFNAYGLIDYDIKFSKVNLALMTLSYSLPDQSSFSVTADYRQSPLLTTTNALIGQSNALTFAPIRSLADLRATYSDQQIYQLAQDRTLVAKSMTVSYSRPLSKKLQTNLDFTLTNTGGTPESGGVLAQPKTGVEYFYGAQLVGSGLIWSNDIYILSARYSDTQRARTYTGDINARIPITSKFRVSPRARYGFRDDKFSQSTFRQFQPTLRLNYYPFRQSEVEIEVGASFSSQKTLGAGVNSNNKERGIVISAGYRIDF
jgi:SPOR domain